MITPLAYVTVALLCVLVARKTARRLFGAGPAFVLWLLPALAAILPWLPRLPAPPGIVPALRMLPVASGVALNSPAAPAWQDAVLLVWVAGSALMLWRLARHYARLRRESLRPAPDMLRRLRPALGALDPTRVRIHAAGPGVLWAPRSLLLLPEDFLTRFNLAEQQLVVRHEGTHVRRGDPLWSALAELGCALLWFHPLAWLALPRLRLDQELACDERVLRAAPHAQARYAHTLLHSIGVAPTPVLIPWLAEPQLKERLMLIKQVRPGAARRRLGFLAVATFLTASAWAVQGAAPALADQTASSDLQYNAQLSPVYPPDAVRNHDQGTVVLDVLVGVDGRPKRITVHSANNIAPSLVQSASAAAMQWRFNPRREHGKAVEGYARVPVKFAITDNPSPPSPAPPTTPAKGTAAS